MCDLLLACCLFDRNYLLLVLPTVTCKISAFFVWHAFCCSFVYVMAKLFIERNDPSFLHESMYLDDWHVVRNATTSTVKTSACSMQGTMDVLINCKFCNILKIHFVNVKRTCFGNFWAGHKILMIAVPYFWTWINMIRFVYYYYNYCFLYY